MKVKQFVHVQRLPGALEGVFHYHTILPLTCIFILNSFLSPGPPTSSHNTTKGINYSGVDSNETDFKNMQNVDLFQCISDKILICYLSLQSE